ncbi:hypothetical protein, partial [Listeria monocytogenes]|uniref:hypothetical protein n=1 Tax=Listeria monocytogenes TaxID=1639 RepID=UPI001F543853
LFNEIVGIFNLLIHSIITEDANNNEKEIDYEKQNKTDYHDWSGPFSITLRIPVNHHGGRK